MSLRQLVEGDCGGVNPLMQLGSHFTRDAALKDEGFVQAQFERSLQQDEQMVNEFLGQVAAPPQSFQMETLLQEMREIEQSNLAATTHLQSAPRVIDEVAGEWSKEFAGKANVPPLVPVQMVHMQPQQQQTTYVREFFDGTADVSAPYVQRPPPQLAICPPYQNMVTQQQPGLTEQFFEESSGVEQSQELPKALQDESMQDWVSDYDYNRESNAQATANYNEKFWQHLQEEWQKLSEESELPWLSELDESYDPYKEYEFAEANPMSDVENAFAKGKEYLAKGDIPSAVLCFEVAAKQEPENADVWEHLGLAQAENEMDPQSIAALKRALELKPDNPHVLMALAVSYTNESLQSQALKMLTNWLQIHPKYKHLVPQGPQTPSEAAAVASSLIRGNKLQEVQNMFLSAVRMNPQIVDAEVQEALGILYNLSSEFDKAVDCFQAALHVNPGNAKIWNRLGASLANGSRSVEAVEAYQQALQLEPGFIRVRYNVGVCCMNLKAYKQAVEHLLTALNMQSSAAANRDLPLGAATGGGHQQMSESIWSTLKMVISLMGRNDLQGFVSDRNLAALNEAFNEV